MLAWDTRALKARLRHLHPGRAYVRIEVLHKERVLMLLAGHSETGSPVLCLAELPDTLALLRKHAFSRSASELYRGLMPWLTGAPSCSD